MQNLRVAWLTHSFHCCAFKFPQRHDPIRHAQRTKYLAELHKKCLNDGYTADNNNIRINGATIIADDDETALIDSLNTSSIVDNLVNIATNQAIWPLRIEYLNDNFIVYF